MPPAITSLSAASSTRTSVAPAPPRANLASSAAQCAGVPTSSQTPAGSSGPTAASTGVHSITCSVGSPRLRRRVEGRFREAAQRHAAHLHHCLAVVREETQRCADRVRPRAAIPLQPDRHPRRGKRPGVAQQDDLVERERHEGPVEQLIDEARGGRLERGVEQAGMYREPVCRSLVDQGRLGATRARDARRRAPRNCRRSPTRAARIAHAAHRRSVARRAHRWRHRAAAHWLHARAASARRVHALSSPLRCLRRRLDCGSRSAAHRSPTRRRPTG